MTQSKPRTRDAQATKARILAAAKAEFARVGYGGARVDEIAEKANANKRMIYHYFGSKECLFEMVLEESYLHIRNAEQDLDLNSLDPVAALKRLVEFTWDYYLENPEFITLVNSANLHQAKHLRGSDRLISASQALIDLLASILKRGEEAGVFRPGVDPLQLNITIAAVGYYYLTNRHTGAVLFQKDYLAPDALAERLAFNTDSILRIVSR